MGPDRTEQNKFFLTLPNRGNLAVSNFSKTVQNIIEMALKWLFLCEEISRIAQQLEAPSLGPHNGNLFSCAQSSQPTSFKIVNTGFLNKQVL